MQGILYTQSRTPQADCLAAGQIGRTSLDGDQSTLDDSHHEDGDFFVCHFGL